MARIVINENGEKKYLNDDGRLHKEDGPANITKSGGYFWYINGLPHNSYLTEPDRHEDGIRTWWYKSYWHSDNRPAYDCPNGLKHWSIGGDIIWPEL